MCCICNRNTDGCDRYRITDPVDTIVGYVLAEYREFIPAGYKSEFCPAPSEVLPKTTKRDQIIMLAVSFLSANIEDFDFEDDLKDKDFTIQDIHDLNQELNP